MLSQVDLCIYGVILSAIILSSTPQLPYTTLAYITVNFLVNRQNQSPIRNKKQHLSLSDCYQLQIILIIFPLLHAATFSLSRSWPPIYTEVYPIHFTHLPISIQPISAHLLISLAVSNQLDPPIGSPSLLVQTCTQFPLLILQLIGGIGVKQ